MMAMKGDTLGEGLYQKINKLNAAGEKSSLYASWILKSPTNEVPKEFTIEKAPQRGPDSIWKHKIRNAKMIVKAG